MTRIGNWRPWLETTAESSIPIFSRPCSSLPGTLKLNRTPKKLLVEALAEPLPDEIVYRPKRGFTLPFEHWLRQELRAEIASVLTAQRFNLGPLAGLINGLEVARVW